MTEPTIDIATINERWLSKPGLWSGLTFTGQKGPVWTAQFQVADHLLQPFGLLHGGVICLVAETVGSVASNALLDPKKQNAVGQTLNATYMRPGLPGQNVIVTANLEHQGRRSHVWQMTFADQATEKKLAIVHFTVAIVDAKN